MPLLRGLIQPIQTLVLSDYISRQPSATLMQVHVNVFLQIRLYESLLNAKMAQVKVQFARHRCQLLNTRNSDSGRIQLFKIYIHSFADPPALQASP